MKKLIALFLLMAMLFLCVSAHAGAVLLTPVPTASLADLVLKPSDDEVKVYASPNLKSNIVGYIIVGGRQVVEVLSQTGDWCRVRFTSIYGTSEGWIPRDRFETTATPTPAPTPTPTPSPQGTSYMVYCEDRNDRLNLRNQPTTSAASLGKYYTGTPLTLTGLRRNGFAQVMIGTVMGWMDERYILPKSYLYISAMPVTTVQNVGSGANLRNGPSTGYARIGWYAHGTPVTIMGVREDAWYHVRIGEQMGFMSASLLRENFPWQYGSDADDPMMDTGITSSGATMYVKTQSSSEMLHLREHASNGSKSLGLFYTGTPVTVMSYTRTGWAYVRIGAQQGYMDMGCLLNSKPTQSGMKYMIQNPYGTGLNLRISPSTSSTVIELRPNYSHVTVLGELADDWCYVQVNGQTGYMMGTRLTALWY